MLCIHFTTRREKNKSMRFFCIRQHDYSDCGVACLATITKQNGYQVSLAKIREIAGTDRSSTNVYGIIKAAESLGFNAKGVKGNNKEAFFQSFHCHVSLM